MILHSEENTFRSRLFFVCFAFSVVEVLILSPVGLGERLMLTLLCFFLVPIGFGMFWLALIVQFYNPMCPKILLKYVCLFFVYGCILLLVLACATAPLIRFLGPEPMDAIGFSLATPAHIGGCLGALCVLKKTMLKLNQKESNPIPGGICQPADGLPKPSL